MAPHRTAWHAERALQVIRGPRHQTLPALTAAHPSVGTGLLWKFGSSSSAAAGFEPDGGAIFGHPGGNAIACPDFWQLPPPHDDLWVYEAGLEPDKGSSNASLAECVGLAGCYWLGRYYPPSNRSARQHHFVPIHPGPKAMMGGDSVGKSFYHEQSGAHDRL